MIIWLVSEMLFNLIKPGADDPNDDELDDDDNDERPDIAKKLAQSNPNTGPIKSSSMPSRSTHDLIRLSRGRDFEK